jgi:Polyketide cyclase / dehydrase and lipid transport
MKYVLYAFAGMIVLLLIAGATGFALPKAHVASVRARYKATPQQIFDAITDVTNGASWRTGLESVEMLAAEDGKTKWLENAEWGKLTMVMDEATSPSRVVSRIADTSEGFGGTWTYEIAPEGAGSVLTITEHGEVYNPMFRFMSKFVFGHYKSLETYATDLGRKFNEQVTPERVPAN